MPKEIAKGIISVAASSAVAEAGVGTGTSVSATAEINTAVTSSAAKKGILGKIAAVSAKTKILSAAIGVSLLGATGGMLYTQNAPDEEYLAKVAANAHVWQDIYREHLLSLENAVGFDLNDFDEDGIPEILVLEENTFTTVYCLKNQQIERVESLQGQAHSTLPHAVEDWYSCNLGYGMEADE